ncbi:hypothetical protein [Natrinema sp. DC36]|uniref:hypothetical protein n=1 Tax=Natrinema sp. DC36 TaxID=2878680 RepID=UPI001CF02A4A|nr:hypothetical protein [Natrinema sp. DC36]
MSQSETRTDKRTARNQPDRHIEPVPANWAGHGTHEHDLEGYTRFYAEKACYEYETKRDSAAIGGVRERHRLIVLYRDPETGEAVDRIYQAAVVETDAAALSVPHSNPDGKGERPAGEWGRVEYAALTPTDGLAVIPKGVFDGEPANFRASIAVHDDERRIGEDR